MKAIFAIFILFLTISPILGQKGEPHGKELPTSIPVKPGTEVREARTKLDAGSVIGRSYINPTLSFQVTFPDSWLIPGPDFEDYMKSAGFDLHTINTEALGPVAKARFAKERHRSFDGVPLDAGDTRQHIFLLLRPKIFPLCRRSRMRSITSTLFVPDS